MSSEHGSHLEKEEKELAKTSRFQPMNMHTAGERFEQGKKIMQPFNN